jgi:predicted TPR repeat methyltransferase
VNQSDAFESALAIHATGALTEAEAAYRAILADEPGHAEARHYLGVVLHQQGRTKEGVELIAAALATDGGSASRYNDLGNIHFQTGDLPSAATAFEKSLARNGGDAMVWNNLGTVLLRQQDSAGAENAFRNAIARDAGFAPALNNLSALLDADGREQEASLYACQAYVLPPLAGKPPKMLGIAYYRLGRIADAAGCYREWLRTEPDNAFAKHHLAACSQENVPAKASDAFVAGVFDEMAENFEQKLVGKLLYRGPEIVAALLAHTLPANGVLDVLDGGCGTGLCAPILKPYARRLTGVDLSSGMLAKARARGLYDELLVAELNNYLLQRERAFDLIVMADTVIYFGDLAPLFLAVSRALRTGGAFIYTLEAPVESSQTVADYVLEPSGRFRHGRRYNQRMLEAAGLTLVQSDDVALRSEFGKPAEGIAVLARLTEPLQRS